jgi:hypothetical protein
MLHQTNRTEDDKAIEGYYDKHIRMVVSGRSTPGTSQFEATTLENIWQLEKEAVLQAITNKTITWRSPTLMFSHEFGFQIGVSRNTKPTKEIHAEINLSAGTNALLHGYPEA